MTLQALLNKYDIKHFSEYEIKRVSSDIPDDLMPNIIPTLLVIDQMRSELGFAISINSAYRNKEHNKEVGGSPTSLHMRCNALDIRPTSRDNEELELMHEWILKAKYNVRWDGESISQRHCGIGLYNTFLHLDTRHFLGYSSPAKWDYRNA